MRKFAFSALAALVFASVAHAQQWDDALQYLHSNGGTAASTAATNFAVWVPAGTCGSASSFPTFRADLGSSNSCNLNSGLYIDINQFARQSDLLGLSGQMALVNAQFSALSAHYAQSLQIESRTHDSGIAQALAMAGTLDLHPDENFAVAMNIGTFRGQTAFAAGGIARLAQHWSFNAGVTTGASGGPMGARAGIRFGW